MRWPWRRSTISRDEYDRRVTELLAANTREVERRREAEAKVEAAKAVSEWFTEQRCAGVALTQDDVSWRLFCALTFGEFRR